MFEGQILQLLVTDVEIGWNGFQLAMNLQEFWVHLMFLLSIFIQIISRWECQWSCRFCNYVILMSDARLRQR